MTEKQVTITLPESVAAFLSSLHKEMTEQDNRATATPYYYVVKQKKKIVGMAEGLGDEQVWTNGDGDYYKTEKEAKLAIYLNDNKLTNEEIDDIFYKEFNQYGVIYTDDKEDNVFLTYRGFLEHMRLNAHNYPTRQDGDNFKENEWVYSYVKHAGRNPEMRKLFEAIAVIGEQLTNEVNK